MDGAVREVQLIDHVADEELDVQKNYGQAIHLISNPKVGKGNREEWSKKNTTLWEGVCECGGRTRA